MTDDINSKLNARQSWCVKNHFLILVNYCFLSHFSYTQTFLFVFHCYMLRFSSWQQAPLWYRVLYRICSFGGITARRYQHLTEQYSVHRQQDITFSVTGDCGTLSRPWTIHITYEKDYTGFLPQYISLKKKSCFTFIQCLIKPDDPDVTRQKQALSEFNGIKVWILLLCLFSQRRHPMFRRVDVSF